jgi:hypothetical protein
VGNGRVRRVALMVLLIVSALPQEAPVRFCVSLRLALDTPTIALGLARFPLTLRLAPKLEAARQAALAA